MSTKRRSPVPYALLITIAALSMPVACSPSVQPVDEHDGPERIILIVADTLRADRIGAYGASVPTPHMNALAKQGQVFPHAVSAFHMTPMSMGSMFTGHLPSLEKGTADRALLWSSQTFCGMARFRESATDACVPERLVTIAEEMSEAGYFTIGTTTNSLLYDPHGFSQGFDEWLEVGEDPGVGSRTKHEKIHAQSRTGEILHDALLPRLRARPSDRFFLFVQYLDVHDWQILGMSYNQGVRAFDSKLGELIAFLEAEGLLEGSVIVLTSDHGELIGERHPIPPRGGHLGNPSYEQVLRVPLIVKPAVFDQTDRMIRGDDLRGMLRSIAAGDPAVPDGVAPREHFVSEAKFQTFTLGRYKSIWPRDGAAPLLLDLESDPDETVDVSGDHPSVLAAHRLRLDALAVELGRGSAPEPAQLDADALERLRALGYLETAED